MVFAFFPPGVKRTRLLGQQAISGGNFPILVGFGGRATLRLPLSILNVTKMQILE